ncbi:hypothetical protein [Tenacibaculum insulae]|uniref:hypothetical protein n=1 Tax=Tenacibaculum insulae TaxID=2029677 RepID=UPI003AB43AB6
MKKKKRNFIKLGIFLIGISLLLWNCQDDNLPIIKKENVLNTISIEDAKSLFNSFKKNNQKELAQSKNQSKEFYIQPLWETIKQDSLNFTNALLTNVKIKTNVQTIETTRLFFMEVNGYPIQAIETTVIKEQYVDNKLKKGLVFYHTLNNEFMTGFIIESGVTKKRIVLNKNIQQAGFFTFYQGSCNGEITLEDILNIALNEGGYYSFDECDLGTIASSEGPALLTFMGDYGSSGNFNPGGNPSDTSDGNINNGGGSSYSNNPNPVDDKIIDNTKNPCTTKIINSLKLKSNHNSLVPDLQGTTLINNGGTTHLSQMVLDLFDHSKKYILTFDIKQLNYLGSGVNGNTIGFNISLDTDLVKDATQLFIAKTIIHESFHAFINYTVRENPGSTLTNLLNKYYDYYKIKYPTKAGNLTHHQFISQYVESLAYSLSVYDNHQQDIGYYEALSWAGLESSTAYQVLPNKTEIQRIITNERLANRNAKGDKCPS